MNPYLKLLVILLFALALALGSLRLWFGGAGPHVNLTGAPTVGEPGIETVLSHPDPIGNVAVSAGGRVFFTVHPEARPRGARLFEWRDGQAVPFPAEDIQENILETPLGMAIDRQGRLWVIDPAHHGFGRPRIVAFDIDSGFVVHEHVFPRRTAPRGSFLQDLQVDPTGQIVYIADASIWRRSPALIVYDTANRRSRRVLEQHPSTRAQDLLIRTPIREMRFVGGLIPLKVGVDGLALDPAGQWLSYGAMNHDTLFRVPTAALLNPELSATELSERVESVGRKPLSDGLSADLAGNVYITDVEHGAVLRMAPGGSLTTIVRTPRLRWADGLSFGPGGWLYVTDSALPEVILQTRGHIEDRGPYHVFRFRPGTNGVPGS